MIDRRTFISGLILGALAMRDAHGQIPTRRLGILSGFARADVEVLLKEMRLELKKLGWTAGRNIEFLEIRTAEGKNDLLPAMAVELVAQGPDVILVQSAPAVRALMEATKTIPIVMIGVGNPREYGMVADYRKPGGNVTGASYLADESMRKTLHLLKEAVPRLRSVAIFSNPSNEAAAPMFKLIKLEAEALGMQAQNIEVSRPGDFEAAFAVIRRANVESILVPPEALLRGNRVAIGDFAQANKLPLAVVGSGRYLPAGGLLSYGPTTIQYARLGASYVDRILKGAKPGDLPIEQPSRFELAINLRTAKVLGLTIPQTLLVRADEVIQ